MQSSAPRQTVVIVDWLGRGGIAHTTEAWIRELEAAGRQVVCVTRGGRDLDSLPNTIGAGARGNAVIAHLEVVRLAIRTIRAHPRSTVVLQGSVLPQIEHRVIRAAHAASSRVIFVGHEASVARGGFGAEAMLAKVVTSADVVVAHTHFVAADLSRLSGRSDIEVVPLPAYVGLLDLRSNAPSVLDSGTEPVALHFGHLHRDYKGSSTVLEMARIGVPGWRLALVGKGAPVSAEGAQTVSRFLEPAEVVGTVAGSAASLLPYVRASQSGAVVLAQSLGSVVLASAVGGIPEQVEDGVTGRLLRQGASANEWIDVLEELSDPALRGRIADQARLGVERSHREFVSRVTSLVP